MPQGATAGVVNERLFGERLERLAAAIPDDGALLDVFDLFVRTASDDALVRIMQPFLSGAELLSNQTFVDLFATETIIAGEGLAVRHLAPLFTDLQGSTALYDGIGQGCRRTARPGAERRRARRARARPRILATHRS